MNIEQYNCYVSTHQYVSECSPYERPSWHGLQQRIDNHVLVSKTDQISFQGYHLNFSETPTIDLHIQVISLSMKIYKDETIKIKRINKSDFLYKKVMPSASDTYIIYVYVRSLEKSSPTWLTTRVCGATTSHLTLPS